MSTTISSNMFKPHYLRHQSAAFVQVSDKHPLSGILSCTWCAILTLVFLRCHPTIAMQGLYALCTLLTSHALPSSNLNRPSNSIAPMVMHSIAQALKCPCVGTKGRGNLVSSRACREAHEHRIAGHLACQACHKAMGRHA